MNRPKVVVLHPKDWAISEYGKRSPYEFHHVSIGGAIPRKRNGKPTFDGYAEVVTSEGVASLCKAMTQHQPDLFLFWMHAGMTEGILKHARSLSPRTKFIHWFGNHRLKPSGNVTNIQKYIDMLFLNSKDINQTSMYKKLGIPYVHCLYDGFNPGSVPLKEDNPQFDVFFGGESYVGAANEDQRLNFPGGAFRKEFVTKVQKNFKTLVCCARKNSWPFYTEQAVFHPEYTNAIRRARININVNHFPQLWKAYTRRTIRSLFARKLHATLYIPGMEEDFVNHRDLVWFHSIKEGLDVIEYYLTHDEERERVAWSGWQLACERFTFERRMHDFIRYTKPLLSVK